MIRFLIGEERHSRMNFTQDSLLHVALDRNDWHAVSEMASIDFIMENPLLPYDMQGLSKNIDPSVIGVALGLPNATGEWDWSIASYNHLPSTIIDHPHLPWDREMMSENEEQMDEVMRLDQEGGLPNATGEWCL